MDKIEQQLKRFGELDVWDVVKQIIDKNEDFIVGLIRGQLWKGEDKEGRTPEYSKASYDWGYIDYKLDTGKIESSTLPHMNLYNTGSFQKAIKAQVKDKYIEILSTDSKANELEGRYGSQILEPNEQRMGRIVEFILPLLQEQIRKQLGYGM